MELLSLFIGRSPRPIIEDHTNAIPYCSLSSPSTLDKTRRENRDGAPVFETPFDVFVLLSLSERVALPDPEGESFRIHRLWKWMMNSEQSISH